MPNDAEDNDFIPLHPFSGEGGVKVNRPREPGERGRVRARDLIPWTEGPYREDTMTPAEMEHRLETWRQSGQKAHVIVRDDGLMLEAVVGGAHVLVVREAERRDRRPYLVEVELRKLDDQEAFELAAREIEDGPKLTSYDRALFYKRGIKAFGSEAEFARYCGVHRATISRNLDVIRACDHVGEYILVHPAVAQRDATWLMGVLGRGNDVVDTEARDRLVRAITDLPPEPIAARTLFGKLRAAVKIAKPRKGEHSIERDGAVIGRIRQARASAPVTIVLDAAGDIPVDDLMPALRRAIAGLRRPTTV